MITNLSLIKCIWLTKIIIKQTEVSNSTNGYLRLIRSAQNLHRPFSNSQLMTGIRSYHFKSDLQLVHLLRGKTKDFDRGSLYINTFKKLPQTRPKQAKKQ